MARGGSARSELLAVGVILVFGAVLVGSAVVLFLWMTNGF